MPGVAEPPIALDTSVAVPLVVRSHSAHATVVAWWRERAVVLSGRASVETYAVLTRLPGDVRVDPRDAATLIAERFGYPLVLDPDLQRDLPARLAALGVAGGATYDAMVALAALSSGRVLATRDARAQSTYRAVGVQVEVVG